MVNLIMRKCCRCEIEKPLDEFWSDKNKPLGKQYSCISCKKIYDSAYQKVWREQNPEKVKARYKRNYQKHREEILVQQKRQYYKNPKQRWRNFLKETGLLIKIVKQWFNKQWMKQQAQCAICGKVFCDDDCIDHDHETNELRGLLCTSCNNGLGFFKDSADICYKAAEYLKKYKP